MKFKFLILTAFTVLTTATAYGLMPPNGSRGCRSDADCGHGMSCDIAMGYGYCTGGDSSDVSSVVSFKQTMAFGQTQTATKQFEVTGWEAAGFCGDLNSLSPSAREKFKEQYIMSSLQREEDLCSVGSPSVLSIHILSEDRDCETDTSAAPMYSAEIEVNYGCH